MINTKKTLKNDSNHFATVAKIRAMYGQRMKTEDYIELMNRQSVAEIADYLKRNTHFGSTLAAIDPSTIHRGMLEDLLHRHLYETYLKIIKFEHLQNNDFYNFRLVQEEIEEILSCIRHLNAKSETQIEDMPIFINKYTRFDMIALAKVRSYDELLELMKHTPYYDQLKKIIPDKNGRIDFTLCEKILRTFYYENLLNSVKSFHHEDAERLKNLITNDIDLINIINAYRMNLFFGESAETIENDMLSFSGRLKPSKEHEIYASANSEEFLKAYAKTRYGRQIIEAGFDLHNLEIGNGFLRYKYFKLALKSAQTAAVSVYSFVYLMNLELRNIITIIEGVRYGVPSKQIESLLIT